MRVVLLDLSACLETRDWFVLVLPRAHRVDGVALMADHLACGERAAWGAIGRFDELTRLHALLNLGFDLRNRGVPHRAFKRIPQQLALLGHRFTLEIFLSRV